MKPSVNLRSIAALAFLSGSLVVAQQGSQGGGSFGAASGLQQGATPAQATVLQSTAPLAGSGCPVSLRAQHKADGMMVQTGHEAHPKGLGQWLHLTLGNAPAKKVAAARITVHGFSDKAHMTQASGSGSDADRTVTVLFSATAQPGEADVWVPEMTAVESIDLDAVAFADGSMWSSAGTAGCRITPDPLMLIAGR
jgi:hypothetical protein